MSRLICVYYALSSNRVPVQEFIDSLNADSQDAFFYKVELLESFGQQLRKPHTDVIGDGIFELRFVGKEGQLRVLFFFYHNDKIIFTNGFVKKTQKTPFREIELARQRKTEYLLKRQVI